MAAIYASSETFVFGNLARLEERISRQTVARAADSLNAEVATLSRVAGDWAGWDDTYAFVNDQTAEYIRGNLPDTTFADLRLTAMAFVDSAGRIVYSKGFDLDAGRAVPMSPHLRAILSRPSPLSRHTELNARVKGLLVLPDGIRLVVSCPIITSERRGPIRGALVFARRLDGSLTAQWSKSLASTVTVLPLNGAALPADVAHAVSHRSPSTSTVVHPLDDKSISGYTLLEDVSGDLAAVLRVSMPRSIYGQSRVSERRYLLSVLAVGLVFALVTLLLLERLVLARLARLDANVKSIGKSGDASMRVSLSGTDELAGLAQAINAALDALERAQTDLSQREEEYRRLFHEALTANFIAGPGGQLLLCNHALATMIHPEAGCTGGRPGCSFFSLFADEGSRGELMRLLREYGRVEAYEMDIVRRDGTRITVVANISGVFDEAGEVESIQGHLLDITERKRGEEERKRLEAHIQQAQKMESLGVLAGGVAHDFNNLLQGILGNAGLALMKSPPGAPARRHIEQIQVSSERASELTKQMLAYSGKGHFIIETLSLSAFVEENAHLLQTVISRKARLLFDFPPDVPPIEADASQMRQVILNLLTNASDALGEGTGTITLSTGVFAADRAYLSATNLGQGLPEGTYVYLSVSDTGAGMTEETRARIFEPFFTTKFAGRGLGLAAVLGIVRGHKGTLEVHSQPGRGSIVKVLFPAAHLPAQAPTATAAGKGRANGGGTVLVADDEEAVRNMACEVLQSAGFTVIAASDGPEALARFREGAGAIDAVLLDMMMPGMDGIKVAREIRRSRPATRIIIASGYSQPSFDEQFPRPTPALFLQKPYHPAELVRVVRKALEGDRQGSPERLREVSPASASNTASNR